MEDETFDSPSGVTSDKDNAFPSLSFAEALQPSEPPSERDYEGDNERTDYELSSFPPSEIDDLSDGEQTDGGYDADFCLTDDGLTEDDAPPPRRGFFQNIWDSVVNAGRRVAAVFWNVVGWVKSVFERIGDALRTFRRRASARMRAIICSFLRR